MTTTSSTTTNGTVYYLDGYDAVGQATRDLALLSEKQAKDATAPGGANASNFGAFTGGVSAFSSTILAGTALAGLFTQSSTAGKDSLEISVDNLSSHPLVLGSFKPSNGDVTKSMSPLMPGGSDSFVLTDDGGFSAGDTNIKLFFFIGKWTEERAAIEIGVRLKLTDRGDPGRWRISLGLDTDAEDLGKNRFENLLQLVGATFYPNTGLDAPSFSIYANPIETNTGEINLVIYDAAETNIVPDMAQGG